MAFALIGIGAVIGLLGAVLYWGNMSGTFVTFPYAGYITIAIGAAIGGAGYKKMASDKAAQQNKPLGT
jgi:hypothetical protein